MAKIRVSMYGYKCERCEHKWIPRKKDYPKVCPKCKSPYWDRAKKVKR
jgi:Zn finger protein HypA/HybF involved in hydrogenase expression